jgi:hypothetical protein
MLEQEARALCARLSRVEPFALHMPMVSAAAISPEAQTAIELHMARGRRELRTRVADYLNWLRSREGQRAPVAEAQRRFTFLRLRFNAVLSQFHIFADVLTQRSEHETGVWLSGLDTLAADALSLPGCVFNPPPVICYLDRSPGAAIRRVRTRLPGGSENPVAIIRVPRERMISSGLASSVVHEVGHQGAALLGLTGSLKHEIEETKTAKGKVRGTWDYFSRWISEIVADFWSVAKLGVTATLGLLGVVSLPRAFVFRLSSDDPHPIPWIRVKLSCAMGNALYPHSQWKRLASVWESYYPPLNLDAARRRLLAELDAEIPEFVALLAGHQPPALGGKSLAQAMPLDERQPSQLATYHEQWTASPSQMRRAVPSLVFAVIGQARMSGKTTPEQESKVLTDLLTHWALHSSIAASAAGSKRLSGEGCGTPLPVRSTARPTVH